MAPAPVICEVVVPFLKSRGNDQMKAGILDGAILHWYAALVALKCDTTPIDASTLPHRLASILWSIHPSLLRPLTH